jgi:N4-(beta-N-acetylglucosaminyl)-L-asparaginase
MSTKTNRRNFIKSSIATAAFTPLSQNLSAFEMSSKSDGPIVLSTWNFGLAANAEAWKILSKAGNALDAVEAGVRLTEADPEITTVGYGGFPDRDGKVTLDACIMEGNGNCGSVAFLEHIKHPISVARKVMEKTPHVMLAGEGAFQFALSQGFPKENLLTPTSEKAWKEWLKNSQYKPVINIENHDTIGMIALDSKGNLAGACTTSGLAFKMHGRIGDSPIIGAALFVDDEVGAVCATGVGESVIKVAGSHLVVEMMRLGKSPAEACKVAVERIVRKQKNYKEIQVGFLALRKDGEFGAYSIQQGFNFAAYSMKGNKLIDSDYLLK